MKFPKLTIAAALAVSAVAMAAPVQARDHHNRWNKHHRHQVCQTVWRHHHRQRVCHWVG